jgi:hypothetical protein
LVRRRGLNGELVDSLIESGDIYGENGKGIVNVVFVHRDPETGKPVGCEIRGTLGCFHQAVGTKLGFAVSGDPDSPFHGQVALCESAIDALSLRELFGLATVSLAGENFTQARVLGLKFLGESKAVWAAFDADLAGDEMSNHLIRHLPKVQRLRPEGGKDWNEVLQRS